MFNQMMRYVPIADLVEKESPSRILEVGSGIRGIRLYLPDVPVVGVDIDFTGLRNAKDPGFYPVKAMVEALPFGDSSFEIVVCSDTLEHVPREEREDVIRELWRVAGKKVFLAFPVEETYSRWEKRLEKFYRFFGKGLPDWMRDHIEKGLPRGNDISGFLSVNKIPFHVVPNENNMAHFIVMMIDEFICRGNFVTDVISPKYWEYPQHSFFENITRFMFRGLRCLPRFCNFGSTVRKIFILDKNEINR